MVMVGSCAVGGYVKQSSRLQCGRFFLDLTTSGGFGRTTLDKSIGSRVGRSNSPNREAISPIKAGDWLLDCKKDATHAVLSCRFVDT